METCYQSQVNVVSTSYIRKAKKIEIVNVVRRKREKRMYTYSYSTSRQSKELYAYISVAPGLQQRTWMQMLKKNSAKRSKPPSIKIVTG